jgi:hypothetical protein
MDAIIQALLAAGIIDAEVAGILQRQQDIDAARAWAEELLTTATQGALTAQQQRLLDAVRDSNALPGSPFWDTEDTLLYEGLSPTIAQIVTERATLAAVVNGGTFQLANGDALRWAQTYYQSSNFGAVPNLNTTSRGQVATAFEAWSRGELGNRGLPDLISALTPTFGPVRAGAIGVTENTRIFVESQRAAEANNDFTVGFRWQTAFDEKVCIICSPLNGQVRTKRGGYPGGVDIPAHTRCRCHESPETAGTLGLEVPSK